ncbi:Hypp5706 [Branchiostoma lanceolatum]|uniref:Hypp5706 protein n=1 Tax=Branchiostoma lanceolatum TaxID=7740 RepID=A0A8J9VGS5_BRALA|nr:Hypp5706 [Branchiostoma lanceolatum]
MADGPLLSLDLPRCFPPVTDKGSALWLTHSPDFGRVSETDLRGRVLGGGALRGAGGGEIGGRVGPDQNSKKTRRGRDQGRDIRREK